MRALTITTGANTILLFTESLRERMLQNQGELAKARSAAGGA